MSDERGGYPLKIIDINDTDALLREALNNGGALATPKESQMMIQMSGVSINAKPRKDGRYQGYVLRDGEKRYFYGRSREEVAGKIKQYLMGHASLQMTEDVYTDAQSHYIESVSDRIRGLFDTK